jgi:hypothetical protein
MERISGTWKWKWNILEAQMADFKQRVDPNRIFWQRNEAAALERQNSTERREGRPATANRPPSYISDDGIDYVLEAEPRSIAPTVDVPLPPHPSERGQNWPMA